MLYSKKDIKDGKYKDGIVSMLRKSKAKDLSDNTLIQSLEIRANYLYAMAIRDNGILKPTDL